MLNVFKFGGTINNLQELRERVIQRANAGQGVANQQQLLKLEVFCDEVTTAITFLEQIEEELGNNLDLAGL